MDLATALSTLGVDRVVWIDDVFARSSTDLFRLLSDNREVAKKVDFPGLLAAINEYDVDGVELAKFVETLNKAQLEILEAKYFEADANEGQTSTTELSEDRMVATAKLLRVAEADKWTFEAARDQIPATCRDGDGDGAVAYVVDLRNGANAPEEGISTLIQLSESGSRGTMFVLTHDATVETEAEVEASIRAKIRERRDDCPPVCVVSKDRIKETSTDPDLEEALKVAIKRAGLRRIVHEVVEVARKDIESAFNAASELLLGIPPEQLDRFIVERGYSEGVSELHVVERAISAKISDEIRVLFSNSDVIGKAERLRSFREIELRPAATGLAHQSLQEFRRLEIFESADLINASYSPVSSGDIFVLDGNEFRNADFVPKRFLLLGQPCDVQIRGEGKRAAATAFLVPLSEVEPDAEEGPKTRKLPFKLGSQTLSCNFRDATSVRLDILDLASFRSDGRVCFDKTQTEVPNVLAGLKKIYSKRVGIFAAELDKPTSTDLVPDSRFCLTFNTEKFKRIFTAKHLAAEVTQIRGERVSLENRVTWAIKRDGRIKPAYAASLLRDFLSISGRDAFDVDFTSA
jgi:hypothetical protein